MKTVLGWSLAKISRPSDGQIFIIKQNKSLEISVSFLDKLIILGDFLKRRILKHQDKYLLITK